MTMQRRATWLCHACPAADQVLRAGPHYPDTATATAGLRLHFLTAHADEMWNPATRHLVEGTVEDYELV